MSLPLPAQTQTLYAELLDRLAAESARRSIGKAPGTFTKKIVSGEAYLYFQFSEPGGRQRQVYLGRKSPALERLVARFKDERPEREKEVADIERLCAQVSAGGGWAMGAGPARVLKSFSDAGVFDAGTVLVGTHAFGVIGNLLGVRWTSANLRTHDVDLAAVSLLAASEGARTDAPGALERLSMGFLPVPGLDHRHPSTSFKVRGEALRVDFLTPGTEGAPVRVPSLGTAAQPLSGMDYLIENPERAAVTDAGGFLVLVPAPARMAVHKLLVAQQRPAYEQTKSAKDLSQAAELLDALAGLRPGDLRLAAAALRKKGMGARLERAVKNLLARHPEAAAAAKRLGT
ncbi:MAG: nucleotidyltransferase domain-containing protein [Elusimicrobia bacterium]|nr:nucleotidyltransferase domain-containing protein [Elusimicrobiota bacterium]